MTTENESTKTAKQRKYDLIELYKFMVEYEDWYNKQAEQASTTDSGSNPGGTPPPPPGSNPNP